MGASCRLFLCARCGKTVVICGHCDHGNRYCEAKCSEAARRHSVREAGRRYQQKRSGAIDHSRRQRRYRASKKKTENSDASRFTPRIPCATHPIATVVGPDEAKPASAPSPTQPTWVTDVAEEPRREPVHGPGPVAACVAWEPRERARRCDFCGCLCDPRVRHDFIRRRGSEPGEEM